MFAGSESYSPCAILRMKTVGIIGGVGPESTIEYYRFIIAGYRERKGDGSYPSIIINSVDLNQLIAWMNANELDKAAEYLVHEIERLARAGADFGALASNTRSEEHTSELQSPDHLVCRLLLEKQKSHTW